MFLTIQSNDFVSLDKFPFSKPHPRSKDNFIDLSVAVDGALKSPPVESPRRATRQGAARLLEEVAPQNTWVLMYIR